MKRKGFTLVEIMIAVGIVTLLLAISLPGLARMRENAGTSRVQAELSSIHKAIVMYYGYLGKFPKSWDNLKDYITIPRVEEKYELNTNFGGE